MARRLHEFGLNQAHPPKLPIQTQHGKIPQN